MDTTAICEEIAHRLGRVESVLDVGCGDGALVRCLAKTVAREAIGTDIAGSIFSEKWIAEDGSFQWVEVLSPWRTLPVCLWQEKERP